MDLSVAKTKVAMYLALRATGSAPGRPGPEDETLRALLRGLGDAEEAAVPGGSAVPRYETAFDAVFAIATSGEAREILDVEAAFYELMGYRLDRVVLRILLKQMRAEQA